MLDPQPVWLPLAEELRAARVTASAGQHALAAQRLSAAAARQPWNAELAFQAGVALLASAQYDAARDQLLKAAALDGERPETHEALGDAYAGLGDFHAALGEWELARALLPNDEGLLFRVAQGHQRLGQLAESRAAYSRLVELRPDDAQVQYQLALLTAALDPRQAISRLTLVSSLSPDLAPTTDQLARAIEAALQTGDDAFAYGAVGYSMLQLGELPLAEAALGQAIALRPDYSDALAYLGLALDRRGGDGLEWYQEAVRADPASPLAHTVFGLYWRRHGQLAAAQTEFERAYELDPDNPGLAAELGSLHESRGDFEAAEAWFRKATELAPEDAEFWLLLALFYEANEIKIEPNGLEAAQRAVDLAPQDGRAVDTLGFALYLAGRLDEAESTLTRAIELDPHSASALYHMGVLRLSQGSADDAKRLFRQVIQLDPQGTYGGLAYKALARLGP